MGEAIDQLQNAKAPAADQSIGQARSFSAVRDVANGPFRQVGPLNCCFAKWPSEPISRTADSLIQIVLWRIPAWGKAMRRRDLPHGIIGSAIARPLAEPAQRPLAGRGALSVARGLMGQRGG
jgi:hypothetical protein